MPMHNKHPNDWPDAPDARVATAGLLGGYLAAGSGDVSSQREVREHTARILKRAQERLQIMTVAPRQGRKAAEYAILPLDKLHALVSIALNAEARRVVPIHERIRTRLAQAGHSADDLPQAVSAQALRSQRAQARQPRSRATPQPLPKPLPLPQTEGQ